VGTSAYKTEDFRRLALPLVLLAKAEAFLEEAGAGMDQVGTGQAGAGMDQVGTGQAGAGMGVVDGAGSDTGMGVGGAR
jgi:hypothetical protein